MANITSGYGGGVSDGAGGGGCSGGGGGGVIGAPVDVDAAVADHMQSVHAHVSKTALEYNKRGDLAAGADIAAFLRIAGVMVDHGAV